MSATPFYCAQASGNRPANRGGRRFFPQCVLYKLRVLGELHELGAIAFARLIAQQVSGDGENLGGMLRDVHTMRLMVDCHRVPHVLSACLQGPSFILRKAVSKQERHDDVPMARGLQLVSAEVKDASFGK
jgi:hypothetical protein